ncbi:D-alanyl-D-alanine carboxypeptidase-like protein [Kineococcus xinjiangensis]|uniref:D-alanyl-D-alanine carboxypeptidase-like protein n=1 Tax=Kineococcus xinjiangensis TaxID=512762 RepID=A0A2S6INZ7_9ACTN|nr:D-alanyl-D-alanine carboxypeptidase family protein [Kineococcus xinjiangensis]PPK95982.1 D-alanyl-D-alanine carboxypeptidase-like protein [Kineococcus xinjiangensis]
MPRPATGRHRAAPSLTVTLRTLTRRRGGKVGSSRHRSLDNDEHARWLAQLATDMPSPFEEGFLERAEVLAGSPSTVDATPRAAAAPRATTPTIEEPGAAEATPAPPRLVRPAGRQRRLVTEVPVVLTGLRNGNLPAVELAGIAQGPHRLHVMAAQAFVRMRAAAARQGALLSVDDSYRSYQAQQVVARRRGSSCDGGPAATPGTSEHGWGLSVDLRPTARALQWMVENGWRYGFAATCVDEPSHWTYTRAWDLDAPGTPSREQRGC